MSLDVLIGVRSGTVGLLDVRVEGDPGAVPFAAIVVRTGLVLAVSLLYPAGLSPMVGAVGQLGG